MKRLIRLATLAVACSFVVLGGGSALAGATPARTTPASSHVVRTATGFDSAYQGTTGRWQSKFAQSLTVSPAELGTGGSATFTTTITATPSAATWTCSTTSSLCHPELIVAGFGHGVGNDRLYGEGSLLYGQDNSRASGYCTNDKFYQGTTFVFGTAGECYSHTSGTGSTETYSVTITGTNTFSDTVTSSTQSLSATFTGMLGSTPTTGYTPAIYLLPGRTATDLSVTWTFTVATTTYSVTG
jgi:hypothetical protein